jgi:protein-tyrosine phosphatase
MQMIFVCTGNTCRSPLAEAAWYDLTKDKQKQVKGLQVSTAGLAPFIGKPAAPEAIEIAKSWDVDLSGHRSKQLDPDVARDTEWLIVMTEEQGEAIKDVYRVKDNNVMVLGTFCDNGEFDSDIADPHGGSQEAYETCAAHIRCGVAGLVRVICGE